MLRESDDHRDDEVTTTTTMFSASVQPALVSLFSSTSSDPLALFAVQTDPALPADSVVCLLEDASSSPSPPPPAKLIAPPVLTLDSGQRAEEGYALSQTVLHIQSPTLRTTYIRCPPTPGGVLGMKHPWIHLQVRNMEKEWSFEAGIVDRAGRQGVVRFSTFQVLYPFVSLGSNLLSYECTERPNIMTKLTNKDPCFDFTRCSIRY